MESPPTTTSIPTIEQSIKCLKDHLISSIDQGIVSHSAVKVYLSSMHLLWAIKQEQHHISQYGYVINIRVFDHWDPETHIHILCVVSFLPTTIAVNM